MSLTFPRSPVVEFYFDRWRDVSTDVRQSPAISITQGRKDEGSDISPCKCTFTLDDGPQHGDGDYNPLNPMGPWFDYLEQNFPMRLSLAYGNDAFTRASASGWGASPTMGAWSSFQSAGTVAHDISSNQGRHSITSTTAFIADYLGGISLKNVDTYVEFAFDTSVTVAGGSLEVANMMLRGQNTTTYYMLRVTITTAQAITLQLMVGSSQVLYGPVTVGTFWGTTAPMGIRFQAEGHTFRGKAWRLSDGEPLAWGLEYSHGDVYGAGWVGIRSGVAAGNSNSKPINFLYDNFTVRLPRFAGEVSKTVPLTEVDHKNQRTQVEASGMRRRLSQGKKILDAPLYRYITGGNAPFAATDFWPLDYELNVDRPGKNIQGGNELRHYGSNASAVEWGIDTGMLQVRKGIKVKWRGQAYLSPASFVTSSGYTVSWMSRIPSGDNKEMNVWHDQTSGNTQRIDMDITSGAVTLTFVDTIAGAPVTLFNAAPLPRPDDASIWHTFAIGAFQSGANVVFNMSVDEDNYQTVVNTRTLRAPRFLDFGVLSSDTTGLDMTQVVVLPVQQFAGTPWHATSLRRVMLGHLDEKSGDRFARLCGEEGISYAIMGYTAFTPTMGEQERGTILETLKKCIEVDNGIAVDPLGTPGLGFRTLRTMVGKDPTFTLDYSAEQVAPTFGPTFDDSGILNDVTAKRPLGDEARYEQATGPKNTADPGTATGAVGRVDTTVNPAVAYDSQLRSQAAWRVNVGTAEGPRFPSVAVNLAALGVINDAGLVEQIMDCMVGDTIAVENAEVRRAYDDIRLLVRGYTETIDTAYQHKIVFNTTPASPYDAFVLDSTTKGRLDSGSTSLNEDLTTTETGADIAVSRTADLWTTSGAQYPVDVVISGEKCTATACSGASSPQTMTLTRSANGVVKEQLTGKKVSLFRPGRIILV